MPSLPLLPSRSMSRQILASLVLSIACAGVVAAPSVDPVREAVDAAIRPILAEYKVPGMAAAVTVDGKHRVFNFGVASRQSGQPVTDATIFEIGSVSKTFTATLGAYVQARGALSLDDSAVKYLPALSGSAFDGISLLELGTYTAGGLPLQPPPEAGNLAQMTEWLRHWQPEAAPGTQRRYSNVSIGLFGHLAAKAMGEPFDQIMTQRIIGGMGLHHTWLQVPKARMGDYAWGIGKDNKPVRVTPGVFDAQAYGIKTTATDMIRFVELNIDGRTVKDETLQRALVATHTGYFRLGGMTQGLGWERYGWPVALSDLQAGNDARIVLESHAVQRIAPPEPEPVSALFNKTGSTNGFGTYVAFVPARRIGVVILANRNLPVPARIEGAYRILQALERATPSS
nr:class C beta-lactamase [Cupriavidus sp. SW-Y-13]